jgi:hypothetical protein
MISASEVISPGLRTTKAFGAEIAGLLSSINTEEQL